MPKRQKQQCKKPPSASEGWSLNIYSHLMTFPFCELVRNNKALHLPSLHLLKSLFFLPVCPKCLRNPTLWRRGVRILNRPCLYPPPTTTPASPSCFLLIPGRLGCGRLLTLTCSSAGIMLASLSCLWRVEVRG